MVGKKITMLDMIQRQDKLEGIIFELREALKYYAVADKTQEFDGGWSARKILKKWDIPWDKIYEES